MAETAGIPITLRGGQPSLVWSDVKRFAAPSRIDAGPTG